MAHVLAGDRARRLIARSLLPPLRAIAASLGPDGRACLFENGDGSVGEARTGAAIARAIAGEEGPSSVAQRILRETLYDAERELGDGTARLAVIMGATFMHGLRFVAAGMPPGSLADHLLGLVPEITAALEQQKLPDYDLAMIAQAAGIDAQHAACLAQACAAVGPAGVVDIVEGKGESVTPRLGSGFILDAVEVVEAFAATASHAVSFDPAHVLVADEIIDDFDPLVPILEGFAARGKALVIVARDVTGSARATLVQNQRENFLRVSALKPRAVAQHAADVLEDLAIATGATLIAERFGTQVASLRPGQLGRAGRFRFSSGRAIFAEAAGDPAMIAMRARLLDANAEKAKYLPLDRERLARRSARLRGRWAEIEIAGKGERETAALLARARAALAATRSAQTGGVVLGEGIALDRAAAELATRAERIPLAPRDAAVRCAIAGLTEVSRQLARNAAGSRGYGGRPAAVSCLDPLQLSQSVVQRALSLAATLLRVDAFIGT